MLYMALRCMLCAYTLEACQIGLLYDIRSLYTPAVEVAVWQPSGVDFDL